MFFLWLPISPRRWLEGGQDEVRCEGNLASLKSEAFRLRRVISISSLIAMIKYPDKSTLGVKEFILDRRSRV